MTGPGQPDDRDSEMERRFREISAEITREGGKFGAKSAEKLDRAARKRNAARQKHDAAQRKRDAAQRKKAARAGGTRGRTLRAWLIAAALVAVAGALTWVRLPAAAHNAANDTKPVTRGAVPSLSATAVSRTAAPAVASGPPADPFAGTPANGYADGAAGIVPPAAAPHGPYSAAEVQAAYVGVRKLLIAANLDPQTLRGGSPTAFASLLTANQRTFFVNGLNQIGLNKQGYQRSTREYVLSFAPGTTALAGSVIKVHGTMSAGVGHEGSREVLRIHVDYVFVYAVEPPGTPGDWMRIVDRNYGNVDFYPWDDPGGALEPWLHLWNGGGTAGARCDVNDGFVHPAYPRGPSSKVRPSGAPINPYDQSAPPPTGDHCHATTGT